MNTKLTQITNKITEIKKENLKQRNEIEELALEKERQLDALIYDVIQIIDAFEKAEIKVKEAGLCEEENTQKVLKRMLQPKKVAMSILSKYNVTQIDLNHKIVNDNICTVVETEPDPEREDGFVISIEKNGYMRGARLIRRAEVIVVKN